MGFLRKLFVYFVNNESFIDKLANTKPIRRSAQFVARLVLQSKEHGTYLFFNREKLLKRLRKFAYTFKEKVEEAKAEQKKNSSK